MSEILSSRDVEELTGLRQPAAQFKWMKDNGIVAYRSTDGQVKTTWFNVNHPTEIRLLSASNDEMPDFGAMG